MNYFEFYDIPVSFQPDQDLIKKKFYALSKTYHPDFYINESEEKQQEILELSTLNNKAYQTLSKPDKLLPYVLATYGEIVEGEKYALPNEFLMEMMEVNEALMEQEFEANPAALNQINAEVEEIEEKINEEFYSLIATFSESSEIEQQESLKSIKDIYYRKKYLLRIRESIDTFASRL